METTTLDKPNLSVISPLFDETAAQYYAAKKVLLTLDISKLAVHAEGLILAAKINNGSLRNSRAFDRLLLDVADELSKKRTHTENAKKLYEIVAEDSVERASEAYKRRAQEGLARLVLEPKI